MKNGKWTRKQLLIALVVDAVVLVAAIACMALLFRSVYVKPDKTKPSSTEETTSELTKEKTTVAETESTRRNEVSETTTTVFTEDTEEVGEIEVEKNLFTVKVTIPKTFIGEDFTEERRKELESEDGIKSVEMNDDGSVTYTMTKKKHQEMVEAAASSIDEMMQEMVGSENYPNFTDIRAEEDYTLFAVTTKNTELDWNESFSIFSFYISGGLYKAIKGEPVDNIRVVFFNADSGEVVSEWNSSDMDEETTSEETLAGIRPEIKEEIDSLEAFFDEYIEFMKTYNEAEDQAAMLIEYGKFTIQYADTMNKMQKFEDEEELTDEESVYYAEVALRINQKLQAAGLYEMAK